jgi:hypothetical protein
MGHTVSVKSLIVRDVDRIIQEVVILDDDDVLHAFVLGIYGIFTQLTIVQSIGFVILLLPLAVLTEGHMSDLSES